MTTAAATLTSAQPAGSQRLARFRMLLLPLTSGARQTVIVDSPWLGIARRVVREL